MHHASWNGWRITRICLPAVVLALGSLTGGAAGTAVSGPDARRGLDFNRDIHPILSENCFACHGPDEHQRKAGLRLDLPESAKRPNQSGSAAIVPGSPEKSALILRVAPANENRRMPPPKFGKRLTPTQTDALRQWIEEGAEYKPHWSFIPPRAGPLPGVKNETWARNPIDRFVLERLEAEGLAPAPEADRRTLVRRLKLDLLGLPPTPAEVDAFVADTAAGAWERLVDRFLASPHFGERLAVDWLDAARFADTHGYHIDSGRDMTRWRDWVINAFNTNEPFDRFTVEQLAGDLLPNASREQQIASGFNRNHMINFEGGAIPEEYEAAYVIDRVNTTTKVWLGLTVACAQCHDHKFDPITQKDYYRLFAFFHNVPEKGLDGQKGNAEPLLTLPTPEMEAQLKKLDTGIVAGEAAVRRLEAELPATQAQWEQNWIRLHHEEGELAKQPALAIIAIPVAERSAEQTKELRKYFHEHHASELRRAEQELASLHQARENLEKAIPTTMVMKELETPRDTFLLERGQYDHLGEKVTAGIPAMFGPLPDGLPTNRLGLAQWLVAPNHPLTARVIVNRYWQMYFGTGLVKTAEDFGSQGEWPSHPDLLDWLAVEFIRSGWNVKAMQRLIVTSATYRQSSVTPPELVARDPENRWLARGPRMRLQAEFIRDQALAVSGLLEDAIGGRSVSPYQPPGLWEELASREDGKNWTAQTYTQSHGPDLYRRTMYTFWKRSSPPPTLSTFDAPDRETCTVRRPRTNTPLQALILLNDPTYVEASRKLAERLLTEAGSDRDRVALAFRLTLARPPAERELEVLLRIYQAQAVVYHGNRAAALELLGVGDSRPDATLDAAELAAWTVVASAILNLDETLTKG